MKKVESNSLESIADYRIVDSPTPSPGPGFVLIRTATCGVGFVDALVALGKYQVKPHLPHSPGQEVGGTIAALGEGVVGLSIGDRVMAHAQGGFSELSIAPESSVTKIPARMTFSQAAGFRVNYITAMHALQDRAKVSAGETLVVLGAAGGVGSAAVQVGKRLGAKVIAVASTPEKQQFALMAGANHAIASTADGFRDRVKSICGDKGPDIVFDPVCGPLFEPAFRCLSWKGRHLVVGFSGGSIPALAANLPLMKGAALVGVDVRQFLMHEPTQGVSHLSTLLAWVEEGSLNPPEGREFSFQDFGMALQYALSGQGHGKTVLRISPEK